MTAIFAKRALLPEGWQDNVRIEVAGGKISEVLASSKAQPGDTAVDSLLPALANLHSHTFQRAMAGMTERRGTSADSFWTWRDLMYRFLQHLTPDDIEAIAAFAFMEMQQIGFASVAEFHYLHHAVGGEAYGNRAELSCRIMAAADLTGIGLTLLPVLYTYAGPDKKPLSHQQLRFKNSLDAFLTLHAEASDQMAQTMPGDARMGVAPHSLRAVSTKDVLALTSHFPTGPFHIHAAEQAAEVAAVLAATGMRPVAWLLRHAPVSREWCFIHATHMTADETALLAHSGAVAGLCPVTEANLGDGIFNGLDYVNAGGAFGVGTDSNVNISVVQELRAFEYGQRLRQQQRNVISVAHASTGHTLYTRTAAGGAQALGRACGAIAPGCWADLLAIDSSHVQLAALTPEQLLDGWIFATQGDVVTDLWSAGRHCVRAGQHVARADIEGRYRRTLKRLVGAL